MKDNFNEFDDGFGSDRDFEKEFEEKFGDRKVNEEKNDMNNLDLKPEKKKE